MNGFNPHAISGINRSKFFGESFFDALRFHSRDNLVNGCRRVCLLKSLLFDHAFVTPFDSGTGKLQFIQNFKYEFLV